MAAALLSRCGTPSTPSTPSAAPVIEGTPTTGVGSQTTAPARSTATAAPAPAATGAPAPAPAGWEQVFADDFTNASLDPRNWYVYDTPDDLTQARSADRVKVSGGELRLIGGLDAAGHDLIGGLAGGPDELYGRWETRIRVDPGAGYTAVAQLWPKSNEPSHDGGIGFLATPTGDPTQTKPYVRSSQGIIAPRQTVAIDLTTWRTVAVEWLPDRVTISVDGRAIYTQRRASSGANPIPFTGPMHLTMQLDKDCSKGQQSCRNASTPRYLAMHIDWVRVYRQRI
ncbi:MAG: glycoside hydrolase family 16 protein [Frankia sp.]